MLSIIYITRNRCLELKKSILSCESHISIPHEYVIVDNGSTDQTPLMIEELKKQRLIINYLFQEENKGVAGGRNIGIKAAKNEICYFIDDDATIVTNGLCLDKAYYFFKNNKSIFAMGTDAYDTERKQQLISVLSSKKNKEYYVSRGYIGCSHFVKTNFLNNGYLYPDNLLYGSEELYAGLQIYRANGIVVQYSDLKVLHEPSINTRTSRKERHRNGHINTYVIKQYFSPQCFIPLVKIFFFMRICRFESFSPKQILKDYRTSSERYNKLYNKKMSVTQTLRLIRLFGLLNVL